GGGRRAQARPAGGPDEGAGEDPEERVAEPARPRGARAPPHPLDPPGEPGDEALVVDSGRVGEAREVPDATAREEASQDEEVRPGTAEAMDEDDGGRMRRRRVEAVARQQAERPRGGERAERRQLAPDRPPPRPRPPPAHDPCSGPGRGPVRRMALNRSTQYPRSA